MHRHRTGEGADDPLTMVARRARGGDERALVELIESTQSDVWRFCAYLAGPAEADDLTQETFARAVKGLARFEARSPVRTWLLAIARRVVADAIRTNRRRRRLGQVLGVVAGADTPAAARSDLADPIVLADLVAHLDEDRRVAFVLTQVLGYPYAEAAVISRCPVGTIRSRVARARADLMAAMEPRSFETSTAQPPPHAGAHPDHDQTPTG